MSADAVSTPIQEGEHEDGDATGVHEDEDVPEQDQGSEGEVSEQQEEAVLVVGVENNSSHVSIVSDVQHLRKS